MVINNKCIAGAIYLMQMSTLMDFNYKLMKITTILCLRLAEASEPAE